MRMEGGLGGGGCQEDALQNFARTLDRLFAHLLQMLCEQHIGYALVCAIKALPSKKVWN